MADSDPHLALALDAYAPAEIAARVETMAEPGGICISGAAYDHVENKLGLEYKNLGEHKVKNIAKPVRVYRISIETGVPDPQVHRKIKLPVFQNQQNLKIASIC